MSYLMAERAWTPKEKLVELKSMYLLKLFLKPFDLFAQTLLWKKFRNTLTSYLPVHI